MQAGDLSPARHHREPKWTKEDLFTSVLLRAALPLRVGARSEGQGRLCGNKKLPNSRKEFLEKVCTREREEDITGGALQKVLDSYDRETTALETIYQEQIQKRDDFNDVGFLLADYCTNCTMATSSRSQPTSRKGADQVSLKEPS